MSALWAVADPYKVAYDSYLVPYIPTAAFYCLLGYVAMLMGYYGPWFREREPRQTSRISRLARWCCSFRERSESWVVLPRDSWGVSFWMGASISGVVSSFAQLAPVVLFLLGTGVAALLLGSRDESTTLDAVSGLHTDDVLYHGDQPERQVSRR